MIHSTNTSNKDILAHSSRTVAGCLVQLDYLGELVSDLKVTPEQKRELLQQVHVITVNTTHAGEDITRVLGTTQFITHLGTTN